MQTATATLYVNPRLDDATAFDVLGELVDQEREKVENAGSKYREATEWMIGVINSVEKRVSGFYETPLSPCLGSNADECRFPVP